MLSTEEVGRSSPPAEEPSMLPRSLLAPACVNPSTLWRSRLQRTLLEASTVCSTRSVATSLKRCSDQVRHHCSPLLVHHCCSSLFVVVALQLLFHLTHDAATDTGWHVNIYRTAVISAVFMTFASNDVTGAHHCNGSQSHVEKADIPLYVSFQACLRATVMSYILVKSSIGMLSFSR